MFILKLQKFGVIYIGVKMARDVFGNKKITKEDMYTKKLVTDADVRMEYYKGFLWIVAGYSYFHFVIMGWSW